MRDIPPTPRTTIPVTAEAVAGFPDQPMSEGATSIGEESARTAVMSMKGNQMLTEENAWAWWQAAIANPAEIGKSLPVHDGDPQQGFYRVKSSRDGKWLPVAIWYQDGEWIALRNGAEVRADEIWTWVCRNPISDAAYEKALAGNGWNDEPPTPARGMGDNLPDDPCERLKVELEGEKEGVAEFLKKPISSQSEADKSAVWAKRLSELFNSADKHFRAEKDPIVKAGKDMDEKWRWREEAKALSTQLKRHMDDYLREQQRIEQERQRKARDEAERIRRAAEEAAISARQSENEYEQAKADRLAREAAAAEKDAEGHNAAAGRTGAKVSLRTFVSAKVTDYQAAATALVDMQHKEFLEFINQLANRAVRADRTLPGVERVEEQRAA